jgi:YHS domain-containing protein
LRKIQQRKKRTTYHTPADGGVGFYTEEIMAMQIDPVCGMQVDDQNATQKSQFQGANYTFCSAECKRKFDQQPEQYTEMRASGRQAQGSSRNR